jgi:hypothetical protein
MVVNYKISCDYYFPQWRMPKTIVACVSLKTVRGNYLNIFLIPHLCFVNKKEIIKHSKAP